MTNFNTIDRIHTAVAVINKEMVIVEANKAFQDRFNLKANEIVGDKCFKAAYLFENSCDCNNSITCPVSESFKNKAVSTAIQHNWSNGHAIVEEITSTPIIEDNGEVNYVVEEFRDVTKLLGLKKGIISICSYCRKLRDEDNQWISFEAYFHKHTGADFSHGICEGCIDTLSNNVDDENSD